jgi:hypothetical protein
MAEADTSKETKTMKAQIKIALASALVLLMAVVTAASASAATFGLEEGSVDARVLAEDGTADTQAADHPPTLTTEFAVKRETIATSQGTNETFAAEAPLRKVTVEAPPGLIGNPTATPRCSLAQFLSAGNFTKAAPTPCPDSTQVGIVHTTVQGSLFGEELKRFPGQLYNLQPQPGQPALFGFYVVAVPVLAVPTIRSGSDYGIDFNVINVDQSTHVLANEFTFWGNPASPAHDEERGRLEYNAEFESDVPNACSDGREWSIFEKFFHQKLKCPSSAREHAFLTLPTDCEHGPFSVRTEVESWIGTTDSETLLTHDDEGNPTGVTRCDRVPFKPSISVAMTTKNAESPSGLNVDLKIPTTGLENADGLAQANVKKAVMTLPEGVTLNPSSGEGLGYCTEAQYESEQVGTEPGQGCPNASRLGSVEIDSPLLEQGEVAEGSLYVAQPNDPETAGQENPFDSLVALYLVGRVPHRGVIIKSAGKVDLDPSTGQITTTFDNLPQLPFSSFKLHFREGGRAPLVTPPSCGEEVTKAKFYPYSNPTVPTEVSSVSLVTNGNDGGACPNGGLPPFKPRLIAGSINPAAGHYSPFYVGLFRNDNEQEITHFSIKLPPGVTGKLAGVPFCPNAGIQQAKSRERIGGGRLEQSNPSCPAASQVGTTLVGGGVGSVLTYIPGKVYLAGPYHGSPLSIAAITSGVVGPFDIGTVAVREALKINPETAEVSVDATGSDPIPHIVDGVPVHLRNIQVHVDRPEFVLNPTSCKATSTASTILGSGLNFGSEADDNPLTATSRFQAADCAGLGFKPRLSLALKGKTKRGANPALRVVLRPRVGNANASRISVALPHSEFLDQGHIRTICTRVQFNAGAGNGAECPSGSVYGHAKAWTPLFSEPLEGPIFLRSSEHPLPDLVLALHGLVNIDSVGRIDSVNGDIRTTFDFVPDAPISKVVVDLQGSSKSLLENSTDICRGNHRAVVKMEGHNGRLHNFSTPLKPSCGKGGRHHARHGKG